jgi:hypothetical protein
MKNDTMKFVGTYYKTRKYMLRNQPNSIGYAVEYSGWSIIKMGSTNLDTLMRHMSEYIGKETKMYKNVWNIIGTRRNGEKARIINYCIFKGNKKYAGKCISMMGT